MAEYNLLGDATKIGTIIYCDMTFGLGWTGLRIDKGDYFYRSILLHHPIPAAFTGLAADIRWLYLKAAI